MNQARAHTPARHLVSYDAPFEPAIAADEWEMNR